MYEERFSEPELMGIPSESPHGLAWNQTITGNMDVMVAIETKSYDDDDVFAIDKCICLLITFFVCKTNNNQKLEINSRQNCCI